MQTETFSKKSKEMQMKEEIPLKLDHYKKLKLFEKYVNNEREKEEIKIKFSRC